MKFCAEEIAKHMRGININLGNRIDADTSGILIMTKTLKGLLSIKQQLEDKEGSHMKKLYLTLLDGEFSNGNPVQVEAELFERPDKKMDVVTPTNSAVNRSQHSLTHFTPLSLFVDPNNFSRKKSLALVQIMTGRTHQIRVTAAKVLNMPVTGDKLYNLGRLDTRRQMLHAFGLALKDPQTNETLHIEAPVANDFAVYLSSLQKVKNYKE